MCWPAMGPAPSWPCRRMTTRDYEFAKKFGLEIIPVLEGGNIEQEAFTEDGVHINSGFLDGLGKQEAIDTMIKWLERA